MNHYTSLMIHAKLEERPRDWSITRAPQIYPVTPGLRERLALALGELLIATGEKLVRVAAVPPQLEKKAV